MCEITAASEVILASDAHAPKVARDALRRAICRPHCSALGDEAELLVSEVVTNSVRHGTPPVIMLVDCKSTMGLRIEVSDGSSVTPVVRVADDLDENGRGMLLVEAISSTWGVQPNANGKTVWFCLDS